MSTDQNRVEAVERALTVLDAFRGGEPELSLATLATRTGLYKSTILRLLGSLERFGYVQRSVSGLYRIGPTPWQLGHLFRSASFLETTIRQHLSELAAETGETAAFYIRSGKERLCLYRVNSKKPIRHHLDEGVVLPLAFGASGRVLMAFSGEPGEPYEHIRQTGHHISRGERDPDVMAVAVPIFAPSGELDGALSVSALLRRFDGAPAERALAALQRHAEMLNDHSG